MRWRVCISVYVCVCTIEASECEFVLVSAWVRVCVCAWERERERERGKSEKSNFYFSPYHFLRWKSVTVSLCSAQIPSRGFLFLLSLGSTLCWSQRWMQQQQKKKDRWTTDNKKKDLFLPKTGPKKCFQFWNWKWEQATCEGGPGVSGAFAGLFLFMPVRNWSRRRELSRSLLVFGWLDKTGIQNVPSTWLKWDQRIVVTVSWSTFTSNWIHLVHLFLPRNVNTLGCSALSWSMIAGNCH